MSPRSSYVGLAWTKTSLKFEFQFDGNGGQTNRQTLVAALRSAEIMLTISSISSP